MVNQIKYGAVISYAALFINILIGLVYTPWMINSIGKADYGLYTLAFSVIQIFVFDFGLSQAVTRFVAKYLAEGRQDKANQLIGVTYKLYLVADVVIFTLLVGVFFFIPDIYKGLTPEELHKFKVVYAVAAIFSVFSFPFIPLNGIISANEKFIQLKFCDLAHKIITVVLMTGCLLLGYSLYALVIVNAISGIATILLKLIVVRRKTQMRIEWHFWDKDMLKAILGFSVWVTVAALAQRCVLNICPSILGMVSDSQNIAIFGIAMTIEGYVYTFASAINGLFLPKVTRMVANNQNDDILPLMIKVGRIQFYIIGMIFLGFICVGQNFINVWVGGDFSDVYLCVILMIAPSFISLAQEIGATTVIVQNKVKKSAKISVIKAVLNLGLGYPLAKVMGVQGMAISIFISYAVSTALFNRLYHYDLGINIPLFFKESLFKMGGFMNIVCALCYSMNIVLNNNGWIHFIIKFMIFILVYNVIMFAMCLNRDEKNLLTSPLKKYISR